MKLSNVGFASLTAPPQLMSQNKINPTNGLQIIYSLYLFIFYTTLLKCE